MKKNENLKVVENSLIAFLARKKLGARNVAMVIGKKIYLSGVPKDVFLKDEQWLKHEMVHIEQFQRYGFWKFLLMYLWESWRKGYYNNKYEVEARERAGDHRQKS